MDFFPLDESLETGRELWSEGVAKAVCRLSARMPFAAACEDFIALTQVQISAKSVERLAHRYGQALASAQGEQAQIVWTESGEWPSQPPPIAPDQRVALVDGTMLNTRSQGWMEAKVGSAARFASAPDPDHPGEQTAALADIGYCVWLGSADAFAPRFWLEMERLHVRWAQTQVALSDAGQWVRQLLSQALPEATHIIDWYHASERLWGVAREVWGATTPAGQAWGHQMETALWEGRLAAVQTALQTLLDQGQTAACITPACTYFRNQAALMNYPAYRQRGLPIGSGTVESACKNVVGARCTLPGMRWTIPGVQAILSLRAELLSHRWDQSWALARDYRRRLPPI